VFGLLTRGGYHTGVFGKVTNDQGKVLGLANGAGSMTYIDSPLDYNNYDGVTYYRRFPNGTQFTEQLDKSKPVFGTVYQTTQIGNRSLDWIQELADNGDALVPGPDGVTLARADSKPFFAYLGPHAPHFPATPAPWYTNAFDDVDIPITPNYNVSSPDKTQHIRQNPPLDDKVQCWENQHFRDRWSTLLSVDEIVGALITRLADLKIADKTFLFYSSDHGYKQGQWRVGTSKQHPYETDIHVPLLARGPGIAAGVKMPQVSGNVDISPTILSLAGVTPPAFMDGKSLLPFLLPNLDPAHTASEAENWRDSYLVEYLSVGTYYNDHSGVYNSDTTPGNAKNCGSNQPRGPNGTFPKCVESEGVGDGNCYFVDSTHSNSWRLLRVINATHDLAYVEYDPTWKFNASTDGSGLQWYELYDVAKDPYQMTNLYKGTDPATKLDLHNQLSNYWQCGADPKKAGEKSTCL
jgi:N-acetylglucosamine-6-sulfatase